MVLQVIHHQKLGQSKEEFLQLNGPQMATASHVLMVLTDAAVGSPFVFHEVLFADWLGKKLITAMFRNTWNALRVSLKAVLGECIQRVCPTETLSYPNYWYNYLV
jgi:hypothetical protein